MKRKNTKGLSILLILMMIAGLLPSMNLTAVRAEEPEEPAETAEPGITPSAEENTESEPEERTDVLQSADLTEAEYPAFAGKQTVDGVTVAVTAEEGAFPKDTQLSVQSVAVEEDIKKAVEQARSEEVKVAASYTFDIKLIKDGEELQPHDESKAVHVSFQVAEAADQNLNAEVFHIKEEENEYTAESLEVKEEGTAVTVETTGFSCYTVEFTYKTLQYVLNGNESVPLSDILTAVGLTGEVSAASTSNENLFTVTNETGEWLVAAKQAFDTTEWLQVTINGFEYEITVTDTNNSYGLWVGNTEVTETVKEGRGWSYDPSGNTLTLNGISITEGYAVDGYGVCGIYWSGNADLNIVLSPGTVNAVGSSAAAFQTGICSPGAGITISVSGNENADDTALNVFAAGDEHAAAVYTGGILKVNNGNVTAIATGEGSKGIHAAGMSAAGGTITASGDGCGIDCREISIADGLAVKTGENEAGALLAAGNPGAEKWVRIAAESPHTHTDAAGNVITFEPWNDSSSLPSTPGSYYLTTDVNMNGGWNVQKGTFNLCLNGKTVRAAGPLGVIGIRREGAVVNLFDEEGNKGALIDTYTAREPQAGGVYVTKGVFNMYGGTISGQRGYEAGGVYVDKGTFNMYGGVIADNSSMHVGGVVVSNSTFSMSGGSITGNKASYDGGEGNGIGGVYISKSTVSLSGNPTITNNEEYGRVNNLCLYDSTKIRITAPMTNPIPIGISMKTRGRFTTNEGSTVKAVDYLQNFSSDNIFYAVHADRDNLTLRKKPSFIVIADSIPAEVTGNDRVYDGTEKPLVTVTGEATGGTMNYAIGTDAANVPEEGWDEAIPTAVKPGTYYVWYMAVGDESHNDSEPAVVTVSVKENEYTVKGNQQEWKKGSSSGLTVAFKAKLEDEKTYSKWNQKVVIDGKEIPASCYDHKAGSLVIDLKPAYLETLSKGEHTMNVTFTDGSASAVFTITEASSSAETKTDSSDDKQNPASSAGIAVQPVRKAAVPNTYDRGLNSYVLMNVISIGLALFCGMKLMQDRK